MNEKEEIILRQKIVSMESDLSILKMRFNNIEKLIVEIHKEVTNG